MDFSKLKIKPDSFVLAIMAAIVIAYFFPSFETGKSSLSLEWISRIGVALIFFFYGLKLSIDKIKHGLKNWKLHVLIQLSTFLFFPLITLVFYPLIHSEKAHITWLGFLFLAALPSTVSSSVVMVSIAKGNIPAAIFNASISGLIGIAITPLWMGLFLHHAADDFNLGAVYIKLLTEILLPVVIGLTLQKYIGKYAQRFSARLSTFDKSIILLIIYHSFARAFEENIFSSISIGYLAIITIAVIALFYCMYYLTGFLSGKLRFNREDNITAQFCGTKKSLIHGTVFSKILFPASIPAGIILLPLMMFHAIQIFIVSIIAAKMAKETNKEQHA